MERRGRYANAAPAYANGAANYTGHVCVCVCLCVLVCVCVCVCVCFPSRRRLIKCLIKGRRICISRRSAGDEKPKLKKKAKEEGRR